MVELWQNIFLEYGIYIKDNQDMTMKAYINGRTDAFVRELATRHYIIPKPMGVGINYEFTYADDIHTEIYMGLFSTHVLST